MSEGARDLLNRGIAAAKVEDKDEARFYLEWVLRTDADRQQKAQAWLWISEIAEDPSEKRDCLEEVLAFDPSNRLARRGLAILDGRLDPAEIVDPDRLPAELHEEPSQPIRTQRFICQKCGGKMAFKPDGQSLRCEYCSHEQTLMTALENGTMVQERDFTAAMATARGHVHPVGMTPFACQGCGASFLLTSTTLSLTCSYCGSAHVVKLSETRQLIPPEGVIPFEVSQLEARRAFHQWFKNQGLQGKAKVTPVRGHYLPAWTFDLSGEIRWKCYADRDDIPTLEEGSHLVYEDDILVPASHKLPADLIVEETQHFSPSDLVPYDESYLADWPAEVYEISVSDASLVARRKALEKARRFVQTRVNATLGNVRDLQLNTSRVVVESFKLVMLPVWIARYRHEDTVCHVLVNGQTGKVSAQVPRNWLQLFIGGLLK